MNSKKRILSLLLVFAMIFGTFNPVFATGLDDQVEQIEEQVV